MLVGLQKDLHTLPGISFLNSHLVVSGMGLQNDHTLDFSSLGTIYLKRDHLVAEKKKTCNLDKKMFKAKMVLWLELGNSTKPRFKEKLREAVGGQEEWQLGGLRRNGNSEVYAERMLLGNEENSEGFTLCLQLYRIIRTFTVCQAECWVCGIRSEEAR